MVTRVVAAAFGATGVVGRVAVQVTLWTAGGAAWLMWATFAQGVKAW